MSAEYTEHVYQEYHCKGYEPIHQREEIVRCKDCKWFIHDEQFGDSCRWWCRNTNPDGFCHGGDRKVVEQ